MVRRRSAWGSVSYDPRRRVGRIRYWAETPDGYRRCSETVRGSRREVEEARLRLMVEHGDDAPCPTVSQAWSQWLLPELERRVSDGDMAEGTLRAYRSSFSTHVSPRWGEVPCDQVRALDVQQWLLGGLGRTQAKRARVVLSMVLDKAVRYEVAQTNAAKGRFLMPSGVEEADKGIWGMAELGEVWDRVRGSVVAAPFLLCAFGSCRVGESLGVRREEVRAMGDVTLAAVARQVDESGRVSERLKTGRSARTVVVPGNAGRALLSMAGGEGWLCDDGLGSPLPQRVVRREWDRLVTGGLHHPIRNLRNSWETHSRWDLGLPPWCVEPMMGHTSGDVTGTYYDRPDDAAFARAVSEAWAAWIARGNEDPIRGGWDD